MKTHYILALAIAVILLFMGCTNKETFDLKLTVAPENKTIVSSEDMNSASRIITSRLSNSLGISPENIKAEVGENQISLVISKTVAGQVDSIKKLITGYARLEFHETYENAEVIGYLSRANNLLKGMKDGSAGSDENPLLGILRPMLTSAGEPMSSSMIGLADEKDTASVSRYLKMQQVKELFPPETRFVWSSHPWKYDTSAKMFGLHAIKLNSSDGKAPVDGTMIISAAVADGASDSDIRIQLTMSSEGTGKFAALTKANINRCIAVVMNGYVISYPKVQDEITGGKIEITGSLTRGEANDLVNIFRSGQLPFKTEITSDQIIRE